MMQDQSEISMIHLENYFQTEIVARKKFDWSPLTMKEFRQLSKISDETIQIWFEERIINHQKENNPRGSTSTTSFADQCKEQEAVLEKLLKKMDQIRKLCCRYDDEYYKHIPLNAQEDKFLTEFCSEKMNKDKGIPSAKDLALKMDKTVEVMKKWCRQFLKKWKNPGPAPTTSHTIPQLSGTPERSEKEILARAPQAPQAPQAPHNEQVEEGSQNYESMPFTEEEDKIMWEHCSGLMSKDGKLFPAKLLAVEIGKDVEVVENWLGTFMEQWKKEHGETSHKEQITEQEPEPNSAEKLPEQEVGPELDLGPEDLDYDEPRRAPSPIRDPAPGVVHEVATSVDRPETENVAPQNRPLYNSARKYKSRYARELEAHSIIQKLPKTFEWLEKSARRKSSLGNFCKSLKEQCDVSIDSDGKPTNFVPTTNQNSPAHQLSPFTPEEEAYLKKICSEEMEKYGPDCTLPVLAVASKVTTDLRLIRVWTESYRKEWKAKNGYLRPFRRVNKLRNEPEMEVPDPSVPTTSSQNPQNDENARNNILMDLDRKLALKKKMEAQGTYRRPVKNFFPKKKFNVQSTSNSTPNPPAPQYRKTLFPVKWFPKAHYANQFKGRRPMGNAAQSFQSTQFPRVHDQKSGRIGAIGFRNDPQNSKSESLARNAQNAPKPQIALKAAQSYVNVSQRLKIEKRTAQNPLKQATQIGSGVLQIGQSSRHIPPQSKIEKTSENVASCAQKDQKSSAEAVPAQEAGQKSTRNSTESDIHNEDQDFKNFGPHIQTSRFKVNNGGAEEQNVEDQNPPNRPEIHPDHPDFGLDHVDQELEAAQFWEPLSLEMDPPVNFHNVDQYHEPSSPVQVAPSLHTPRLEIEEPQFENFGNFDLPEDSASNPQKAQEVDQNDAPGSSEKARSRLSENRDSSPDSESSSAVSRDSGLNSSEDSGSAEEPNPQIAKKIKLEPPEEPSMDAPRVPEKRKAQEPNPQIAKKVKLEPPEEPSMDAPRAPEKPQEPNPQLAKKVKQEPRSAASIDRRLKTEPVDDVDTPGVKPEEEALYTQEEPEVPVRMTPAAMILHLPDSQQPDSRLWTTEDVCSWVYKFTDEEELEVIKEAQIDGNKLRALLNGAQVLPLFTEVLISKLRLFHNKVMNELHGFH